MRADAPTPNLPTPINYPDVDGTPSQGYRNRGSQDGDLPFENVRAPSFPLRVCLHGPQCVHTQCVCVCVCTHANRAHTR